MTGLPTHPWTPSSAVTPGTWGAFLEYAAVHHGVQVDSMLEMTYPDGRIGRADFLVRKDSSGEPFAVPLPMDWKKDRSVGFFVVENVCERLGIEMPRWQLPLM